MQPLAAALRDASLLDASSLEGVLARLESRGLITRAYASSDDAYELARAVLVLWRHLSRLDAANLRAWVRAGVGGVVNCAHPAGCEKKLVFGWKPEA